MYLIIIIAYWHFIMDNTSTQFAIILYNPTKRTGQNYILS